MQKLLSMFNALTTPAKVGVIAVPLAGLMSCFCLSLIGVGYMIGSKQEQDCNPFDSPEFKRAAKEGEDHLRQVNDIKEKYLAIMIEADRRGDRKAANKANADMEEAIRQLDLAWEQKRKR